MWQAENRVQIKNLNQHKILDTDLGMWTLFRNTSAIYIIQI